MATNPFDRLVPRMSRLAPWVIGFNVVLAIVGWLNAPSADLALYIWSVVTGLSVAFMWLAMLISTEGMKRSRRPVLALLGWVGFWDKTAFGVVFAASLIVVSFYVPSGLLLFMTQGLAFTWIDLRRISST